MASLTFRTTYFLHSYGIHFTGFKIVVKFFVDAVEFVPFTGSFIEKIDFRFPMTVNTPSHAQLGKLVYLRHFLDIPVTGLTILLTNLHMLTMIEINMIGEIMNFYPLNWFTGLVIFF